MLEPSNLLFCNLTPEESIFQREIMPEDKREKWKITSFPTLKKLNG